MNDLRTRALAAPTLALCAAAAYCNTFRVPFVFDDLGAVVRNASLRSLRSAFAPPPGGFTVTGRPLLNLTFALNHLAGALHPAGYHLANLAIHVLATLVLFGLLRRTLGSDPAAFGAALLWSLHPLQTEAVTYVSQRAESLMGLLLLFTIYSFRQRWLLWSVLSCLCGMATKEVMAVAPVLVLFYDRAFVSGSMGEALRRHRIYYAALATTWAVLALEVIGAHGRGGTAGFDLGLSWTSYLWGQGSALVHYLRLALWPSPLVFDYGLARPFQPAGRAALAAILVLALIGATVWALVRRSSWGYAGLWFFAILAPTSLVPGNRQTWAEHRMYLALAPLAVIAALALTRVVRGRVALALVAAGFAVLTFARNRDYSSALSLWRDTAAKRPGNAFAQYNLGEELLRQRQYSGAQAALQRAIALRPDYAEAYNNLGLVYLQTGRADAAHSEFITAARLKPEDGEIRNNLGNVLLAGGDLAGAEAQFRAAIGDDASFDPPRHGLAAALGREGAGLLRQGRTNAALAAFAAAVKAEPDSSSAHFNYGNALAGQRRLSEAIGQFEAALRLNPNDALVHYSYGSALLLQGRDAEARQQYAEALRLKPDFPQAKARLQLLGN